MKKSILGRKMRCAINFHGDLIFITSLEIDPKQHLRFGVLQAKPDHFHAGLKMDFIGFAWWISIKHKHVRS